MSAIPQSASGRLLSERLTAPLRVVAQRQWYVLAAVGVLKTLIVSLVAILATALLLGYFQNLWFPVRAFLALATWAVVIGSAVRFLRPVLARWSLGRAAMQIEQQQPELHERLSSAVELANETDPAFRGSPSLIAHLMRQAEGDAIAVKPEQVVSTDRIVRWALLFAPVLLAWLTVALIPSTTKTAMAGLYRVLMPWKDALPAMLSQVVVKPGDLTLVQGDAIDISAHVSFDAGSNREVKHATLVRKFDNGQRVTDDMEMATSRDYRIHFDDLQQSFSYMVATDQGDSAWFKATVHPRPTISSIDVRCDYPAYSGLSSTVVSGREGGIEALVGTRVTLTIHTELPVVEDKSHIVIDEGKTEQLILPLKQLAPGKADYQAQLVVSQSGEYRINLTNEFDLNNKDEQPRSIVAQPDEAPTIVINSPEAQVTVRPDDTVPVRYVATDDFAVAKIEAVIQVDDHPVQTVPVTFKTNDKRTVNGSPFRLSVADVLKSQSLKIGDHITYQLKVTDNRDPDPQFSFSTKQTLKINREEYQSFAAKEEKKIAEDLQHAIQKAINELTREQQQIQPSKDVDARQKLEDWNHKELHLATAELSKTSRSLAKAADEALGTVFDDVAKQVKKIATKPIRAAAEDATQADLSFDNGQDRKDAATKSIAEIIDARDQLQKLIDKQEIQKDEHKAEAARDLADAAKKQQEVADALAKQAQTPPQAKTSPQAKQDQYNAAQKQAQASQKLQQALQQDEALRDPKAAETAQKLEDLIKKVEEAEKQQDAVADQTEKQQDANDIQQKANEIAQKQEELNKDIQKSADQNKDALQKANAQTPNKDQQNDIVKNLDKNNLQQAHEQMKQAAAQLKQEAQQLANAAKSNDLHPTPQQQDAQNKDQQAQQNAQNQQNQAQQAANDLKQEAQQNAQQNAKPKADDAAIQNAKQAAKNIEKQAQDLKPQNADAQKQDQAAQQDAQAAEKAADKAAQDANPQDAQKDLNDAAADLNKAAAELADAAKKNADADKADAVKAEQKDAQAAADQANQQAAAQDALAKQVEAQQADLAKAQQNQPAPDQAAQQQNQVADQAKAAGDQAQQLQQQAQDAKNADVAKRAEDAKADLADAQKHAAEAAKDQQDAAKAQQDAAAAPDAAAAKAAEQAADNALEKAANNQQQAQDALAKAEGELRNLPQDAQANAQQPDANAAGKPDANTPPAPADANAQGQPADPASGSPEAGEKAAEAAAAQAAQEAAQAQGEAAQQNAQAAQQAANALAKAAQAMAKALPGNEPGQEPGEDPGMGEEPSTVPGQTKDPKQGIAAGSAPATIPGSVRNIGITADQWATLPPLAKKDLMNAAQQSGPPSYRQMIKDYYVRIARIQQTAGSVGQ